MSDVLRVGHTVYGYCGGLWGNDGLVYDTRRVEAIGEDWVILRDESGDAVAYWGDPESLLQYPTGPER